MEQEEPPVELRTPQELEGCVWATPHGEWEQEEPPVEHQDVEEGGAKETPQELEGCVWETPHGHGDGKAGDAVEEDQKDNGRDHEEAREPPTEGRTWRRPNPAL